MSIWWMKDLWKQQEQQREANIIIRRCSTTVASRALGSCGSLWVGRRLARRTETSVRPVWRKRRYITLLYIKLRQNSSSRRAAPNRCIDHSPARPKLVWQQRGVPISWAKSKRTTLSRDSKVRRPSSVRLRNRNGSTYPAAPPECQSSLGLPYCKKKKSIDQDKLKFNSKMLVPWEKQESKGQKLTYQIYRTSLPTSNFQTWGGKD